MEFTSQLTMYFACESQGVQPGRTCERNFNRMRYDSVLMVVNVLLGFYPVVSLIYVINIRDVKKFYKRWRQNSSNTHTGHGMELV